MTKASANSAAMKTAFPCTFFKKKATKNIPKIVQ